MKLFKQLFLCLSIIGSILFTSDAVASHFHSAEIYYECITTGPDAGKFKFFAILYRDCSGSSNVNAPQLTAVNVPNYTSIPMSLAAGYPQDATPTECGLTCADAVQDISLEQYLYESPAVEILGTPPPSGYKFYWEPCCRIDADNLVNPLNLLTRYELTMYPYNGLETFPCYDTSPDFAEPPASINCSGYELRYNPNAIDIDLDSLSYRLIDALPAEGAPPVQYETGFSGIQPFPGPNTTTFEASTGQLIYDSNPGISGRYTVVMEVNSWRCGQLISSSVRDMTFGFAPCNEVNNIPQVAPPTWISPATGSGYSVTVDAGDPVSFTLEGVDNDVINGQPQTVYFTAEGAQFSSNYSNPNSGNSALNPPFATLSNVTPPASATGSVATEFFWQTDCDHVGVYDECGNLTNTYNFLFKFKDDYCPANGSNVVNIAVTVLGEAVLESPQPHCASNDGSDNIILSWQTIVDNNNPPAFEEYVIFHSTSPTGPFNTEVGTVTDINTGTWTHSLGNPNPPSTSGPNYYQIRTRSGCGGQVLSAAVQTISSIYLTMTEDGTNATLNWTPVATPPFASSNGNGQGLYQVYREYPTGTWTLLNPPTTDLFFVDPIVWCNEQVNYRVELTDNLPCTSVSNVVGDILTSGAQPASQPIDSVVVDPITGYITVCWPPNASANVVEYHVLLNTTAFSWEPMDTVYGYNNTCWTDSVTDASSAPLWYQVFAVNNCNIPGVPAGSIANGTDHHETIWLSADYDSCEVTTELTWTPYWYWPEGVQGYIIYSSENNGPFVEIGSVSDTTFTHEGLQETAEYCYYVRAIRNGSGNVTATSNGRCIEARVPKRPDYGYQYNTTVQPGNTGVEDYFFSDSLAGYIGFEIQRGTEPDNLNFLWFVDFDPSTRFYDYVDAGAQPQNTSYYYSVIGVDSCENYSDTLNMTRTIYLEATPNSDRTNTLEWNAFEGWNGGVSAYNIYRSYDGPYTLLKTVGPNQLTALDSIEEIIEGEGNFCYYIEAVEGTSLPVGTVNPVDFTGTTSRSNEDCAKQHPNLFIPNAFMPEGVNNVFKPITIYVETDSYLFQVYNRWGQRVFESNDPDQGWDGNSGSKENPQGAYVYFVSFVSADGQTFTKRGTITLIR